MNYVLERMFCATKGSAEASFTLFQCEMRSASGEKLTDAVEQTVKHIIRDYLGSGTLQWMMAASKALMSLLGQGLVYALTLHVRVIEMHVLSMDVWASKHVRRQDID